MRRTLLAVAALAVALSACELRAEIAINEDGEAVADVRPEDDDVSGGSKESASLSS
ncbi:MAG: hypothetical protein WEB06_17405 [Actinomycetota bacterium]